MTEKIRLKKDTLLVITRNTTGNLLPGWTLEVTLGQAIDDGYLSSVNGTIDVSFKIHDSERKNFVGCKNFIRRDSLGYYMLKPDVRSNDILIGNGGGYAIYNDFGDISFEASSIKELDDYLYGRSVEK